jgi:hypothetical protein
VPGVEAYGAIALNRSVGGVNPAAVERMAMMHGGLGRLVFMPTFDSEYGHVRTAPNPNFVSVSRDGRLLPEVEAVLDVVAKHGLALATGHSSPAESLALIEAARSRGIDRIVVTHPPSALIGMSLADQQQDAQRGALLEYPISIALEVDASFDEFVAQLREVGIDNVVLSTDLGQVGNPVHTDGGNAVLPRLDQAGFAKSAIDVMTRRNPARLLGLP